MEKRKGGVIAVVFCIISMAAIILVVILRNLMNQNEGEEMDVSKYADRGITKAYMIPDENGTLSAYDVFVTVEGYREPIETKIRIDREAHTLLEVQVLSQNETPELGGRITEDSFLNQFAGKTLPIQLSGQNTGNGAGTSREAAGGSGAQGQNSADTAGNGQNDGAGTSGNSQNDGAGTSGNGQNDGASTSGNSQNDSTGTSGNGQNNGAGASGNSQNDGAGTSGNGQNDGAGTSGNSQNSGDTTGSGQNDGTGTSGNGQNDGTGTSGNGPVDDSDNTVSGSLGEGIQRIDGVYQAEGEPTDGYTSKVTMVITDGEITEVHWDSYDENGNGKRALSLNGQYSMTEDGLLWADQADVLQNYVIEHQGMSGLVTDEQGKTDVISGVSISITEFKELVNECLMQAAGGNTEIADNATGTPEGGNAADNTDSDASKVDGVSGATVSSQAVVTAVQTAYEFVLDQ